MLMATSFMWLPYVLIKQWNYQELEAFTRPHTYLLLCNQGTRQATIYNLHKAFTMRDRQVQAVLNRQSIYHTRGILQNQIGLLAFKAAYSNFALFDRHCLHFDSSPVLLTTRFRNSYDGLQTPHCEQTRSLPPPAPSSEFSFCR